MPAHIHPGTCTDLVPQPTYPLANVVDGASETEIVATLDGVRGWLALNLHASSDDWGTYTACAELAEVTGSAAAAAARIGAMPARPRRRRIRQRHGTHPRATPDDRGHPRPAEPAPAGSGASTWTGPSSSWPAREAARPGSSPTGSRTSWPPACPVPDRGRHLHQQGGRGDARPDRGLIGPEATREATIGTFHSICARILRREGDRIGLTPRFTIYDRADQLA